MEGLEVIDDWARFDALEADWRRLARASPRSNPCIDWEWASSWVHSFGASVKPIVIVDRDHGEVRGIAPFVVAGGRYGVRQLRAVGQAETGSEEPELLVAGDHGKRFASATVDQLVGPLTNRWDSIHLSRVSTGSPSIGSLIAEFETVGIDVANLEAKPAPVLELNRQFGSVDDFVATRSKNFRRQYRRATRRAEEAGAKIVSVDRSSFDAAFDRLVELHELRVPESRIYDSPERLSFQTDSTRAFLESGVVRLRELQVDGRSLAVLLDIAHHTGFWSFQTGWHPDAAPLSPGMLLTAAALEEAIEAKAPFYDFGQGDSEYKWRWSNGQRDLQSIHAFNTTSPRGRALALGAKGVRTARPVLRVGRQRAASIVSTGRRAAASALSSRRTDSNPIAD